MYIAEYTITRHRNGYIEVRDCQGNFIQTADTMKEASNDIKKLQKENGVCFNSILKQEIEKISG